MAWYYPGMPTFEGILEIDVGPALITILADVDMALVLPVNTRLFYVLLTKKTELDAGFRILSLNLTAANILFAFIYCLVMEPAAHGAIVGFFQAHFWWLGRIDLIGVHIVLSMVNTFHLVIAVNRWAAVPNSFSSVEAWSARVTSVVCFGVYLFAIILSLPIIFNFNCVGYKVTESVWITNASSYVFKEGYDQIYPMASHIYIGIIEFAKFILYIIIGWELSQVNELFMGPTDMIAKRATMAAFVAGLGGYLLSIFFAVSYAYWISTGKFLFPFRYYNALFKSSSAIIITIPPWAMLCNLGKDFLYQFFGIENVQEITSTVKPDHSTNHNNANALPIATAIRIGAMP